MEQKLGEFEQKQQICSRWKPGDEEFSDGRSLYFKDKQESLRHSLWAAIVKWQYLLKLKSKYAGVYMQSFNNENLSFCAIVRTDPYICSSFHPPSGLPFSLCFERL